MLKYPFTSMPFLAVVAVIFVFVMKGRLLRVSFAVGVW